MAPVVGYADRVGFLELYGKLKSASIEADVDEVWMYILRRYFKNDGPADYSIIQQQRPAGGRHKTKSDLMIRAISNGRYQSVIFVEDKRVLYESSNTVSKEAVEQLQDYMLTARSAINHDTSLTMWGVATVGRYSRFYVLYPRQSTLQDYPGLNGRLLEFKRDEETIDAVLLELVRLTSE